MPFEFEHIDKLLEINSKVKKSKITSLYFALPANCREKTGFEQLRTKYYMETKYSDWKKLISYSIEKGFDFVYLINSPRNVSDVDKILEIQLQKLDILIQDLKKIGCWTVRVSNTQILDYVLKKYPEIRVLTSTSFEHMLLCQYQIFLAMYPQIKEIVPSFETHKNFKLLKNLRKSFPNLLIELMVNEGCIQGCPIRTHHNLSVPYLYSNDYEKRELSLRYELFNTKCSAFVEKNFYNFITKNNLILPWEIEEYSKIGINNFKLVGRNNIEFFNGKYMSFYEAYLRGVDDYQNIKNVPYRFLNNACISIPFHYSVDEIRPYLPRIDHFVKKGHLCASICGIECTYCYDCARKLKNALKK